MSLVGTSTFIDTMSATVTQEWTISGAPAPAPWGSATVVKTPVPKLTVDSDPAVFQIVITVVGGDVSPVVGTINGSSKKLLVDSTALVRKGDNVTISTALQKTPCAVKITANPIQVKLKCI